MERLITLGRLLDYYGAFLTPRQRGLVRQYAYEDCSLAEISEREGISRQAVRDAITRAERELTQMEDRLRLIDKSDRTRKLLAELEQGETDPEQRSRIQRLKSIWEDE